MNELKKHSLKVRVVELENRLNNLKALVDNIAFNQEQIVKAFEVDAEEVSAIDKFKEQRAKYLEYFKDNPEAKLKNLVFGELNKYESYLLERKHLNHHFEQFGLI